MPVINFNKIYFAGKRSDVGGMTINVKRFPKIISENQAIGDQNILTQYYSISEINFNQNYFAGQRIDIVNKTNKLKSFRKL